MKGGGGVSSMSVTGGGGGGGGGGGDGGGGGGGWGGGGERASFPEKSVTGYITLESSPPIYTIQYIVITAYSPTAIDLAPSLTFNRHID